MDFIFDEFIEIKYENKGVVTTAYVKASEIVSIEARTVDTCSIILNSVAYYAPVMCSAQAMRFKVDEARARQARKLDNVVRALSKK